MPHADTLALQHAIDRLLKQAYKGAKQAVEAGFRLRYSAWTEPEGNEPAEFPAEFSSEEEIATWIAGQGGLDRDEKCNRIDAEIARLAQALRMFRDSFHETHLRTEHSATPIPERLRPAILFGADGPIYRANKLASKLRFIICREAAPGLKDNYAAFPVPTEAYPRIKEALATLEFPDALAQWEKAMAADLKRARERLSDRLAEESGQAVSINALMAQLRNLRSELVRTEDQPCAMFTVPRQLLELREQADKLGIRGPALPEACVVGRAEQANAFCAFISGESTPEARPLCEAAIRYIDSLLDLIDLASTRSAAPAGEAKEGKGQNPASPTKQDEANPQAEMKSKSKPKKRKAGRPRRFDATQDRKLVADWNAARRMGSAMIDFCKGRGVSLSELDKAISRERYRRRMRQTLKPE